MPKLTLQAKQVLNETMRAAMRRETLALLRNLPAENLTMELLAERLGVAKGTLYNYYQNKQELITDALHGIHLQVAEEITAVATNTELPPDEKILGYTGILFDNFNRYREIYATICSTEKEIDFQDRQRAQNIRRFLDEFARELTRGAECGLFSPIQDPAAAAMVLYSTIVGMMRLVFFGEACYRIEECRTIFRNVVVHALYASGKETRP